MNNSRFKFIAILVAVLTVGAFTLRAHAQGQFPGRPPGAGGPPHGNRPGFVPPAGAPAPTTVAAPPHAIASRAEIKPTTGEQFFIVASVDLQKSQLLLKHPTEVTLVLMTSSKTQFADDAGKPLKLSDFRSGDTVWVTSSGVAGDATATRIRKGIMSVADLHRFYLDYPEIK